jgi:putative tricarboxylic transport membrane protein
MNNKFKKSRRSVFTMAAVGCLSLAIAGISTSVFAAKLDSIHFLIPGGAGGGWDGTARGTGEALTKAGIIKQAKSTVGTLMVNSTPIVIRSLTKVFPQNFRDLTMVAGTIGDYAAFIVGKDSKYKTFSDLQASFKADPRKIAVGGGSVPGGMDHLVAAMAFQAAGEDPTKVKYIPYDAGGKAMAALLSGEIAVLSTGLSEAIALSDAGEVRILATTASERVSAAPNAQTFKEQGVDVEFVNWRGFFAAPNLSNEKRDQYIDALAAMYETPEWEVVRERNGWVNIYNAGDDFTSFLEKQEKIIGDLMRQLGFL